MAKQALCFRAKQVAGRGCTTASMLLCSYSSFGEPVWMRKTKRTSGVGVEFIKDTLEKLNRVQQKGKEAEGQHGDGGKIV
ncbi:hypothetical protein SUGI_1099610 [Cryptomeria japonica]|nr:hypothetical protein SUGI_1099610 [Cryptomeria japonica]